MGDLFTQPPEPTGEELKREGMRRAVEHADRVVDNWSASAFNMLVRYIAERQFLGTFRMEDVRTWAEERGLPIPPTKRAWGPIAVRAAKNGHITKIGHTTTDNPKAHRAFISLWQPLPPK